MPTYLGFWCIWVDDLGAARDLQRLLLLHHLLVRYQVPSTRWNKTRVCVFIKYLFLREQRCLAMEQRCLAMKQRHFRVSGLRLSRHRPDSRIPQSSLTFFRRSLRSFSTVLILLQSQKDKHGRHKCKVRATGMQCPVHEATATQKSDLSHTCIETDEMLILRIYEEYGSALRRPLFPPP